MTREAMKLALAALESITGHFTRTPSTLRDSEVRGEAHKAITSIKAALAAPVQEPDAIGCKCSVCGEWQRWTRSGMVCKNGHGGAQGINRRLYTTPPAAQHQPLTPSEYNMALACVDMRPSQYEAATRAIEAKLKEKNT